MTGEGLVCKLKNIQPIDGADKIVQANLFGETVIISKDYQEGQLGILFDIETQLSEDFAKENNLYRHNNLNKDTTKTGYLEDNRRVRPIKLRGVKCSAMWMPIESLEYTSKVPTKNKLPSEGTQITDWNGFEICKKYVRPTRGSHKNNKVAKKVQQVLHFAEHLDTDQLMRNLHRINIGDKIIVTSKLHGTSCRVGLLPTLPRNRFKRWWYEFWNKKLPYKMVVGSRHALKHVEGQAIDNKDSYYDDDIWTESAYKNFHGKLMPGETVYYEIVGFLPSGSPIMPTHSNDKLKKFLEPQEYKEFIDKFGKETVFHYGCNVRQGWTQKPDLYNKNLLSSLETIGEYKIFVYRITLTTENGQAIDLSWRQLVNRCEQLGVNSVSEIFSDLITKENIDKYRDESFWLNQTEQDDKNYPHHLNEGLVCRLETSGLKPEVYKSKRFCFKVLENIIKDNDNIVDLEETN